MSNPPERALIMVKLMKKVPVCKRATGKQQQNKMSWSGLIVSRMVLLLSDLRNGHAENIEDIREAGSLEERVNLIEDGT